MLTEVTRLGVTYFVEFREVSGWLPSYLGEHPLSPRAAMGR
jgi:hypothetical protein